MLELRGITKRYPGVLASDDVRFDLQRGEVHALLGENGAGKSTLMNILYGLTSPDEGEILVNGTRVDIASPLDAIALGVVTGEPVVSTPLVVLLLTCGCQNLCARHATC